MLLNYLDMKHIICTSIHSLEWIVDTNYPFQMSSHLSILYNRNVSYPAYKLTAKEQNKILCCGLKSPVQSSVQVTSVSDREKERERAKE